MASNFFEEMFETAVRIVNERRPSLSPEAALKEIRSKLRDAMTKTATNDEFMDEFESNFNLCTIKWAPRRTRREERQAKV